MWVNIRRQYKMWQLTKHTAKCKNVGYICQLTPILFNFFTFHLFGWHGTGGQSVRIYTDAVEFIILVNLLLHWLPQLHLCNSNYVVIAAMCFTFHDKQSVDLINPHLARHIIVTYLLYIMNLILWLLISITSVAMVIRVIAWQIQSTPLH